MVGLGVVRPPNFAFSLRVCGGPFDQRLDQLLRAWRRRVLANKQTLRYRCPGERIQVRPARSIFSNALNLCRSAVAVWYARRDDIARSVGHNFTQALDVADQAISAAPNTKSAH
jgi:hypothetical protein